MDRPSSKSKNPTPPHEAPDVPERRSAQQKAELVFRLLRGKSLDSVSRESQVPAHELESWQPAFLQGGTQTLMCHTDPRSTGVGMEPGSVRGSDDAPRARRGSARKNKVRGGVEEAQAMRTPPQSQYQLAVSYYADLLRISGATLKRLGSPLRADADCGGQAPPEDPSAMRIC